LNELARRLSIFLSVLIVLLSLSPAVCAKQKKATKTDHSVQHKSLLSGNYLVPPPPAYTPAWLPDMSYQSERIVNPSRQLTNKVPEDSRDDSSPYKKYIYTAPGHRCVEPVHTNKYVTYWSKT
jgi:hypothetical protein